MFWNLLHLKEGSSFNPSPQQCSRNEQVFFSTADYKHLFWWRSLDHYKNGRQVEIARKSYLQGERRAVMTKPMRATDRPGMPMHRAMMASVILLNFH